MQIAGFVIAGAIAFCLTASVSDNVSQPDEEPFLAQAAQPNAGVYGAGTLFDDWDSYLLSAARLPADGYAPSSLSLRQRALEDFFQAGGSFASGAGEGPAGRRRPFLRIEPGQGLSGAGYVITKKQFDEYYGIVSPGEAKGIILPGGWMMTFAPGERLKNVAGELWQDPRLDTLRRSSPDVAEGVLEGLKFELSISF